MRLETRDGCSKLNPLSGSDVRPLLRVLLPTECRGKPSLIAILVVLVQLLAGFWKRYLLWDRPVIIQTARAKD